MYMIKIIIITIALIYFLFFNYFLFNVVAVLFISKVLDRNSAASWCERSDKTIMAVLQCGVICSYGRTGVARAWTQIKITKNTDSGEREV